MAAATDTPAGDGEHVEIDLQSFNRAERGELQRRFGNDFDTLRKFVLYVLGRKVGLVTDLKLTDPEGRQIFADDVFIAMVWITRRRSNPDAEETDFDHLGIDDLKLMIAPKASPTEPETSTEKKT